MLSEEKLRELPAKPQQFWREAFQFVQNKQTEWAWVEPGTEQFASWVRYFDWKGWQPFALRQISKKAIFGMTMPTEWPEWFDASFAAHK